jgi:hypothetical protein
LAFVKILEIFIHNNVVIIAAGLYVTVVVFAEVVSYTVVIILEAVIIMPLQLLLSPLTAVFPLVIFKIVLNNVLLLFFKHCNPYNRILLDKLLLL